MDFLSDLAIHSVLAPNEEVATKNRTALTRENVNQSHTEFKRIRPLFFRIRLYAFGVQNGVRKWVGGTHPADTAFDSDYRLQSLITPGVHRRHLFSTPV
jgi:hypothetical protein